MKVLVLDDDDITLYSIGFRLSKSGHQAIMAHTASEAFELLKKEKPDVVIADIMMPYMSGLEFLSVLQLEMGKKIPTIVISALNDREVINKSFQLGASDYIVKPVKTEDLQRCLHKIESQQKSYTEKV